MSLITKARAVIRNSEGKILIVEIKDLCSQVEHMNLEKHLQNVYKEKFLRSLEWFLRFEIC